MLQLVLDTIPVRVFWKDSESELPGLQTERLRSMPGCGHPKEIVGRNDLNLGWADLAEFVLRR